MSTKDTAPEGPELAKGDKVRIGKGYQLWTVERYFDNWFLVSDPSQAVIAGSNQIRKPLTPALRKRLTKVTPEIQAEMNNVLDRKNGWM